VPRELKRDQTSCQTRLRANSEKRASPRHSRRGMRSLLDPKGSSRSKIQRSV
jgi:hypothetical protein